jgi:hypothetical protein
MIAEYAGTTNKVGNGFGVFFIFLYDRLNCTRVRQLMRLRYLAFQGTGQDTTMYLWVSEIFPTGAIDQCSDILNYLLTLL